MRAAPDFDMLPALTSGLPECEPMTPEQVAKIDDSSMSILEEVGVIDHAGDRHDSTDLSPWRGRRDHAVVPLGAFAFVPRYRTRCHKLCIDVCRRACGTTNKQLID